MGILYVSKGEWRGKDYLGRIPDGSPQAYSGNIYTYINGTSLLSKNSRNSGLQVSYVVNEGRIARERLFWSVKMLMDLLEHILVAYVHIVTHRYANSLSTKHCQISVLQAFYIVN